jgi:hypothetical protein
MDSLSKESKSDTKVHHNAPVGHRDDRLGGLDNETEYIKALINRAQEFAGDEEHQEEPKKPKAKRQYSEETKAKMVERLRVAREKSLETRKLKAGIRDGIKQESKEQEKFKLMELSAKYTKPVQSTPSTKQVEIPKHVQETVQPYYDNVRMDPTKGMQPYYDNVRMDPTKGMKPTQPIQQPQPARPKYFLPTMSHAKKWNMFNNPL